MRFILYTPILACMFALASCGEAVVDPLQPNPGPLDESAYTEMLALTDTATLSDFNEFHERMIRIREIFTEYQDLRGAFAVLYEATTRATLPSFEEETYDDMPYTRRMVLDFSKRYLYALHDHLRGIPSEFHWAVYFDHAASGKSVTRLIFDGINAHITIDLARALAGTGVYPEYEPDYLLIGDNIAPVFPEFTDTLEAAFGVDAEELFNLYFIGDLFDAFLGEGGTVAFGFNLIRTEAFDAALLLQDPEKTAGTERNLRRKFEEKSRLIANLDRLDLFP